MKNKKNQSYLPEKNTNYYIFSPIMILKIYKSNVSIAILLIPLFAIILSIPILTTQIDLNSYYFNWENVLFNSIHQLKILNFILTFSFLILNTAILNQVFSITHFFSKITYVPALFYLVLMSFIDVINFEPYLIIHTLLSALIYLLMRLEQNETAIHLGFKSALIVGILACFSLYYAFIIFTLFMALFTIKSFNWREWFVILLGGIIPIIYLFSFQYIFNDELFFGLFKASFKFQNQIQLINYIQIGSGLLILLLSFKGLLSFYSRNTSINKKRLFILFGLTTSSFVVTLIAFYFFSYLDFGFILPLSILLSISSVNNESDNLLNLLLTITLIVNIVALYMT